MAKWEIRNAKQTRLRGKQIRRLRSDVLGSYTGVPLDDDTPVQDADDL